MSFARGAGCGSLERYRDETIAQWHTRMIDEVALAAAKRAYANMVWNTCKRGECLECQKQADKALAHENAVIGRAVRMLRAMRAQLARAKRRACS